LEISRFPEPEVAEGFDAQKFALPLAANYQRCPYDVRAPRIRFRQAEARGNFERKRIAPQRMAFVSEGGGTSSKRRVWPRRADLLRLVFIPKPQRFGRIGR
jgi:hypothetical protein